MQGFGLIDLLNSSYHTEPLTPIHSTAAASILSHLCISQNQFGKIIWTSLFHHMQLLYLKIRIIFSNLPSEVSLCILGFLLIKKSHIVPIRSKPLSTPTDIYKSCVTKVEELSKRLTCLEVSCFFS